MSLPRAPKAVVFDMDGLLFDTEALYQRAFIDAAKLGGFEVSPEAIQLVIGMPSVRGRGLMLSVLGDQFAIDDYYARMTDRFVELSAAELRLKPGVLELLDVLDRLELPRCIATSSAHSTVWDHLSAHNLTDRFLHVVGHATATTKTPNQRRIHSWSPPTALGSRSPSAWRWKTLTMVFGLHQRRV
jgi:beta-phosphoglucomutase-like phosphatase (HAD superfamily)